MESEKYKLSKEERDASIAYLLGCASMVKKFLVALVLLGGVNVALVLIQILLWLLK